MGAAVASSISADVEARFQALFVNAPVILAPMEDVTDAVFRKICRDHGANLCVTEFVNVEGLLRGCRTARRKITLTADDAPTAIQIYGSNAERLAEAARVAEEAQPAFLDINCGCWVPKVAGRGAGAGWLKEPDSMVAMVAMVTRAVSLPVTVKTRIGYDGTTASPVPGTMASMPILELAPRLEDAGARAITLHCRTAKMGHSGDADWSWAARVRERVSIPVIVNGDVKSAESAKRALEVTKCTGVMVGRRAIEHPWVFAEARALLDHGIELAPPTAFERIALCRRHLVDNVAFRGQPFGVQCTRRHLSGYLRGIPGAAALRHRLNLCDTLDGCLAILDDGERRLQQGRFAADPMPAAHGPRAPISLTALER